ncbi:hypothetical protein SAMN05660657_00761 [Geodermatophilus amargosae]|uniref:Uncharacterized protein n=1 Tax=Geodermatophilus amargosae TaxID=1296565 RepID=A0A1I6XZ72_9ACTN|nr:hypothetical protein [Geodermatophilus amargosae]SFT43466.1 hypothetical protein SAMN05660657_00761 [Geodermatophilus amargosae]
MIVVLVGTVVLAPVVVMADLRRWRPLPVLLWLIGTALAVAWVRALGADVDRADATGGRGSILAGIGWLVTAVAAAVLSVAAARRGRPRQRPRHGR